jgi:NADH:ubiquinone oxidoreductase subunit 6 (subunit J)
MEHLGAQLFSRHLIAVEVAGTMLLAALVGAVAIAIQSKQMPKSAGGPRHG